MVLQVLGCGLIATGSGPMLYWGLSLFLTGSGLNVTCINMMLTQRFTPDDPRREGARTAPIDLELGDRSGHGPTVGQRADKGIRLSALIFGSVRPA